MAKTKKAGRRPVNMLGFLVLVGAGIGAAGLATGGNSARPATGLTLVPAAPPAAKPYSPTNPVPMPIMGMPAETPTRVDWKLPAGVKPAPGAPGSEENPYAGDIYGADTFVFGGQPSAGDIMAGKFDSTPNTGVTYYTSQDFGSEEAANEYLRNYYANFR